MVTPGVWSCQNETCGMTKVKKKWVEESIFLLLVLMVSFWFGLTSLNPWANGSPSALQADGFAVLSYFKHLLLKASLSRDKPCGVEKLDLRCLSPWTVSFLGVWSSAVGSGEEGRAVALCLSRARVGWFHSAFRTSSLDKQFSWAVPPPTTRENRWKAMKHTIT